MYESIAGRVGRLIAGSVNAIVNAMEDSAPEVVMKEAIREVILAMDEVRAVLGKEVAGKHLASQRLANEKEKLQQLNNQATVAVQQQRDDLAQAAISRILNIEAQLPVLEKTIADHTTQKKELEGYIQALRGRKSEMEEEFDRYQQSLRQAATVFSPNDSQDGDAIFSSDGVAARVERAGDAFGRVLKSQTGSGLNQATIHAQQETKLAELETITRNQQIQERLAHLKTGSLVNQSD